jgi:hypothetical protein
MERSRPSMSHSRLGCQSWSGKVVARIDLTGEAVAVPALSASFEGTLNATLHFRIERQTYAEGRQFENARMTS